MSDGHTVKYIPAADPVHQAGVLRIELVGGQSVDLRVGGMTDEDRQAIAIFAFNVDQEPRRLRYIEQHYGSCADPAAAYERVMAEWREDFGDWHMRQRGDRERFEGIDRGLVRTWIMNR